MQEIINRFYPYAISNNDFVRNVYKHIDFNFGVKPHQILIAQSICTDDVNSLEFPEESRQVGPFNLGGLDGYPFTGITGMEAFAHHIPDGGSALVFYAPHIGIGRTGEPGKISKLGQHQNSSCCCALVKALSRLKSGTITKEVSSPLDYQQQTLESIIWQSKDRIESSENEHIQATEVLLEASEKMINEMIVKTHFLGKYLFIIGAVIVNGDWNIGSYIEVRRFDCIDVETKKIIKSINFN